MLSTEDEWTTEEEIQVTDKFVNIVNNDLSWISLEIVTLLQSLQSE